MLTIDKVRRHLKIETDAEDDILEIYVRAAVQAAEEYSGERLSAAVITEPVDAARGPRYRLSSVPTGPIYATVTVNGREMRYPVVAQDRWVMLPFKVDPCGCDVAFTYHVGPDEPCDGIVNSEPMIELGILKFVAHAYNNRGDGPNSWAVDSGASEMWSTFRPIAWG